LTTQDVNTFFQRHNREFGVNSNISMTGGQGGVAYGIEGEKNPQAFITVYRRDGEKIGGLWKPSNKPVVIKREALEMTLAKRVREGRPDSGSAMFALQPVKVASEVTEVISSSLTKSRKRRKRRSRSRG
jgi:hypothetical protein